MNPLIHHVARAQGFLNESFEKAFDKIENNHPQVYQYSSNISMMVRKILKSTREGIVALQQGLNDQFDGTFAKLED